MSIGASLALIAVGAILRFAVNVNAHIASVQVNWNIVGDILIAIGLVGLAASLFWMAAASRRGTGMALESDPPEREYR